MARRLLNRELRVQKTIAIFLFLFSYSVFSNDFLEIYKNVGTLKEDLKIYSTGLIKLNTNSFTGDCSNQGGQYQKRFKPQKLKSIFNLAKNLKEEKKDRHSDENISITLKFQNKLKFIDINKQTLSISKLEQEIAFLMGELDPVKVIRMKTKKLRDRVLQIDLLNLGASILEIRFPVNINDLFYLSNQETSITDYKIEKIDNNYRLTMHFDQAVRARDNKLIMNTDLISRFSKTPYLKLCTDID